jgi:hypothetical protein
LGGFQLGGFQGGFQAGFQGGFQGFQLGGCGFGGGGFNFNFGAFQLAAPAVTIGAGESLPLVFFWEVPQPGVWQDIRSLEVRFKDPAGSIPFWTIWDQSTNAIGVVEPGSEGVTSSGQPGQNTTLETNLFRLLLSESASQSSGPTGQVVAVLFQVAAKPAAAGQTYALEVRGKNDAGVVQGFNNVGSLQVRGANKDDKDNKRLTNEQRDQLRRGNALGSDSLRAEGNVIAAPHCLSSVSTGIDGVPGWLTDRPGPWIIFADRDGIKRGDLRDEAQRACESIRAGDYVTGHGTETSDREFEFESISVHR